MGTTAKPVVGLEGRRETVGTRVQQFENWIEMKKGGGPLMSEDTRMLDYRSLGPQW